MKKIILLLLIFIMFFFTSCSLNISEFTDVMTNNNLYCKTIDAVELNIIYDKYLTNTKKYERNSLPVIISLVSKEEINIDINKMINDSSSFDFSILFNDNFVGLAIDFSNVVNAEVAWGLKYDLIKSIKENNVIKEDVKEDIFELETKKIGSTIFYGTEDFIEIIQNN